MSQEFLRTISFRFLQLTLYIAKKEKKSAILVLLSTGWPKKVSHYQIIKKLC